MRAKLGLRFVSVVAAGEMLRRLRIALAILLTIIAPQTSIAQTASVPGKSGVSAAGAAGYNVPISVPPGTAGMIPSLSLDYNSQSAAGSGWLGAGVVGVGWSLSGLPAIGRCPRTFTQDGVRGALNYDANDRFCLDGQRLIATTGAYGADGTEYRTEIESFSKITSRGTAGTGPAWFEVRSKSGQILQFGNTTDSRILAQGKTTARSWGVNKVSDTKGNYFTVTYVNDTANGQAYPSRVDYTANDAASLVAYNSVRFVYDSTRPDVTPIYHAGSLMKTTVRLTNVQTYAGSSLVADYRLAYQQGSATGRSQLRSVTLCEGAGSCLPATTFTWQNGGTTPTIMGNVAAQNGGLVGSVPYLGDFNGDGRPDIMWDSQRSLELTYPIGPWASAGARVLWTNTGSGGFAVTTNFLGQDGTLTSPPGPPPYNYYLPVVADFNRDGRSDVLWINNGNSGPTGSTVIWRSAAGGGYTVSAGPAGVAGASLHQTPSPADLTGDSRSDLLWTVNLAPNVFALTVQRTNPDGTPTITLSNGYPASDGNPNYSQYIYASTPRILDFNGDGRGDVLWSAPNGVGGKLALWLGDGNGGFSPFSGSDNSVYGYIPYYFDVNGDGNTDVLWDYVDTHGRSAGQRILWISKGDGTFVVQNNVGGQNGTLANYVPVATDLNGDGLSDVLWVLVGTDGRSAGAQVAWIGKGDGAFTVLPNFAGQNGALVGYSPLAVDFNGDGKTDVLWDSRGVRHQMTPPWYPPDFRSTGVRTFWLSDGISPDVITAITSGMGTTSTFTYKWLTDSSVYTKDNTATDPIIDVQMPLQVVSRVDASNGVGGTVATGYAYVGAKSHLDGRGFLGFRQLKVTDLQTGIVQTTTYRQDYPYLFLAASDTQTLGLNTLSTTTNTYSATSLGGTRFQIFQTQGQVSRNDLDGTSLPTATTTYQYDAYNNATQVVVSSSDGYIKTTNNTYTNDTANWFLGRLTASSVTAQAPQQLGQYCALPWGGTITNGQSVTAYSANPAPVGQACSAISQTRTCTNGTLSGSYSNQSCAPAACTLPWGGTIASGQSVTAYSTAAVPAPQTCSSVAQTRSCTLGTLSGSYGQQSCVVRQPKTTTLVSGSSWIVPLDWNNSINKIQVIGGGGMGGYASGGSGVGGGGGGGAYSSRSNLTLTPGVVVSYGVGMGGASGSPFGGHTWFNGTSVSAASVSARGGSSGAPTYGGSGGQAANGIGTIRYSGGNGGNGNAGGGGGGGGAAGPSGNGGAGATAYAGAPYVPGSPGAGGGSGGSPGGAGGVGARLGGQMNPTFPGGGAVYGGGGGGSGGYGGLGNGAQGLIIITYTPAI